MKKRLSGTRRGLLALATAATVGLASVATTSAPAAAAPMRADRTGEAVALVERLGDRSAGAYLDPASGRVVVAVTDEASAARVRAVGALPKLVRYSTAELKAVETGLVDRALVPGSAVSVDPVTNQVVIEIDTGVTGARLAQVRSAVARAGAAARIERLSGPLTTYDLRGGERISAGSSYCSAGIMMADYFTGDQHVVTAGHCTAAASTWSVGGSPLGTSWGTHYPGDDFGFIRSSGTVPLVGEIKVHSGTADVQNIGSVSQLLLNSYINRSGATTGARQGRLTAVNVSVRYTSGHVMTGMFKTTACAEPGDSGGPFYVSIPFIGTTAYGLTSGGSGNCSSGGVTYAQPLDEVRDSYPNLYVI
ncbi:streptogrisin D [Micromonospora sp. Llam0]|uniref:S1 family peptidase n=1 Tax=Micromonospora sp. Llam0 TaxID=2485143 RepID=UPI000F475C96|nr:S1 family peptidase [Micromonospora sp. Llam0]ROO61121.1 streptogrisin D [Micromonospora sp. Llam0]